MKIIETGIFILCPLIHFATKPSHQIL